MNHLSFRKFPKGTIAQASVALPRRGEGSRIRIRVVADIRVRSAIIRRGTIANEENIFANRSMARFFHRANAILRTARSSLPPPHPRFSLHRLGGFRISAATFHKPPRNHNGVSSTFISGGRAGREGETITASVAFTRRNYSRESERARRMIGSTLLFQAAVVGKFGPQNSPRKPQYLPFSRISVPLDIFLREFRRSRIGDLFLSLLRALYHS